MVLSIINIPKNMGEIYPDEESKYFNQNNIKKTSLVTLDAYGINISKQAAEGKLDPVVGRENEILRVIQILGRRRKNNPVLVGEPGVGKTAIVEGLAMKIIEGSVPSSLLGKIIYTLELSTIVAGTKYRGQFEERMKAIVDELSVNPHVIIFIDEMHTLVGAGGSSGSLDASNIIKPALARGEIRCIGATTFDEFRENIEGDGALDRRFQKVVVEPPSMKETETILLNIRHKYESYHNVSYSDEIIALIVKLANDYVIDRYFPDKAVDILDEVGSYKHLVDMKIPKKIKLLEERLNKKENAKVNAVAKQDYELAATERDMCVALKIQIEKEYEQWKTYISENKLNITEEDVLTVVSKSTGIPLERITDKENKNLLGINDYLSSRIIGQKEAIDKISITIQRNRIGIRKRDRTAGNFIFLGPTGVGKCVTSDTLIKIKNNKTGEINEISIKEFKKLIKNKINEKIHRN